MGLSQNVAMDVWLIVMADTHELCLLLDFTTKTFAGPRQANKKQLLVKM